MGFIVVARYDDCQMLLRDPSLRQGRDRARSGAVRAHRSAVAGALRDFVNADDFDARPGPARPHPAPAAGREGVHPQDGREAAPRHRATDRRAARPIVEGVVDVISRARAGAADVRHRRDARRARVDARRAPAAHPGGGCDARVQPDARAARRSRGRGRWRSPSAFEVLIADAADAPDRRPALASSSTSRSRATSSLTTS